MAQFSQALAEGRRPFDGAQGRLKAEGKTFLVVVLTVGAVALSAQAIRSVPRITIDELKTLMDQKAVVVLDVREPASFGKSRIPGAININYTDILRHAERLAGEKRTIVAYCACVNEMTAARAAVDLAARGIPGARPSRAAGTSGSRAGRLSRNRDAGRPDARRRAE